MGCFASLVLLRRLQGRVEKVGRLEKTFKAGSTYEIHFLVHWLRSRVMWKEGEGSPSKLSGWKRGESCSKNPLSAVSFYSSEIHCFGCQQYDDDDEVWGPVTTPSK